MRAIVVFNNGQFFPVVAEHTDYVQESQAIPGKDFYLSGYKQTFRVPLGTFDYVKFFEGLRRIGEC